jgi:hypothetical protein
MSLLDKLNDELKESRKSSPGQFRVITKKKDSGDGDSSDANGSGEGSQDSGGDESQGGQPGEGSQESGKGGEKQDSSGSDDSSDVGEEKPGEGGGEPSGNKPKITYKDGQVHIDGKPMGPKQTDDHSGQGKGAIDDFDDIIKKVYDEVKERGEGQTGAGGSGKGGFMEKVEKYLKPKFNINPIIKRLDDFKRLIGKQIVESKFESYSAAAHNPASQTGEMMRPSKIPGGKKPDIVKESAILIFAVDTSGSISGEDYKSIYGYLNKIEEHFAKKLTIRDDHGEKVGSIAGEVYLVEWDDGVHLPMRKWTQVSAGKMAPNVKDAEEALKLRGGGGTDINQLFGTLDKVLYREVNGKPFFDMDETSDYINMSRDPDDAEKKEKQQKAKHFRVPLKKQKRKEMKEISKDRVEQDVDLTPGEPNFLEGRKKVANVPFLLIYTDGWFAPADYTISKLYADNPGNILYILTDRGGLGNLRPVNVMFHDIHGQDDN